MQITYQAARAFAARHPDQTRGAAVHIRRSKLSITFLGTNWILTSFCLMRKSQAVLTQANIIREGRMFGRKATSSSLCLP